MPPEDEILPAKEQPLPAADSPTADLPGYIPESDPEEDPEEDDDEDPADYPADGGDDSDDKDEPSDDDEDEEVDIEADDEEEEEHPALADSTVVALPAIDQAPSAEETEPFETDESVATPPPHPAYHVIARISIPAPVPTPVWSDVEVARLLAISTLLSSPLSPWSSPLPQIPFPPLPPIPSLPVSPPLPQISLPPLPVSSLVPVLSPSPPASPICIALVSEIHRLRDSLLAASAQPAGRSYGNYVLYPPRKRIRPDTDEVYTRLDDEQTGRQLLACHLNMLFRDRRAHARTARLMETEARMSREDWGRSMDASDLACADVMSLRTVVLAQQSEI
ncbi:hypothetical protein Tco_0877931 [Tanacetum coccineum]|uniref:Uncharacterized protein n=1 Tax=Tanacetum coccineum TaxID=301880 RepID=A0ABQ5BWF6_9ASTR